VCQSAVLGGQALPAVNVSVISSVSSVEEKQLIQLFYDNLFFVQKSTTNNVKQSE
jgi:hypothetical protein